MVPTSLAHPLAEASGAPGAPPSSAVSGPGAGAAAPHVRARGTIGAPAAATT